MKIWWTFFKNLELVKVSLLLGFILTVKKLFFIKNTQKKKENIKKGDIKKKSLKYKLNNLKIKW